FRQSCLLLAGSLLLSPFLPSNSGRVALAMPLASAAADASRLREREPAAAVLGMAAWIGASPTMFLFLNASSNCLFAWGLLPDADRARFGWLYWFVASAPLGLFVIVAPPGSLFFGVRPSAARPAAREAVGAQVCLLGPPTAR